MLANQDAKSLSKERYSQFAQAYVTSQGHAKGTELDRLIDISAPQPHWIVLDVATGGGHAALQFAPFVARVVATDITPEMLGAARSLITETGVTNVVFELADAENLPFPRNTFDLVTCRIAPHHFPDCRRFVQSSVRALKAGGMLLVQDHVLPEDGPTARTVDTFEKLRDPSHHRAYNESEWIRMYEDAGMCVEHTEEVIKRHDFLTWAERQGCTKNVIEQLTGMLDQASASVRQWMQPQDWGTPDASFVNHHLIIAGRKLEEACPST